MSWNEKKKLRRQSQIALIQKPPNGGWGWVVTYVGVLTIANWSAAQRCFSVLYLPLMDEFQASLSEVAWLNGLLSIAFALSNIFIPFILRKFGYRKTVMACGLLASLSIFSSSFATQLWKVQLLCGFITGLCLGPSVLSIFTVSVRYFSTRRNMALQCLCSGFAIGGFAFCPIYQVLITNYGWRGAMQIISGFFLQIVVCGAVMFPIVLEEDFESENVTLDCDGTRAMEMSNEFNNFNDDCHGTTDLSNYDKIKLFCKNNNLNLLISCPFYLCTFWWDAFAIAYFVSLTYLIQYGKVVIGLTDIEASTLISAIMIGEAISRIFFALVLDRLSTIQRPSFVILFVFLMGLVFIVIPFLQSYATLLIGCVCIGITGGGIDGYGSSLYVDLFELKLYSSVFAYSNIITHFVMMASTIIIGKVVETTNNYMLLFFIASGFSMISCCILFYIKKHFLSRTY